MEKRYLRESLPVSSLKNTFLKGLKVNKGILSQAQKEGSSREFFFKLVELLSEGKLKRREIKELNHRELIVEIVKENHLEEFFFPSRAKSFYNALRKAFKLKEQKEIESLWEKKLKDWRSQFEHLIKVAANRYLVKVEDEEKLRELYLKGWLLPSDLVMEFKEKEERFYSEEFLRERLELRLSLPPFKRREKILKDILRAFRENCLELAIYALFPQTEGVIWDLFVRENTLEADVEELIRKRNRKFVTIQYTTKLLLREVFKEEELPPFLNWLPFVNYREGLLNRHAIGHGVAVNFGTKENFLKLFLFLDFLGEISGYVIESKR